MAKSEVGDFSAQTNLRLLIMHLRASDSKEKLTLLLFLVSLL